MANNDQNTPGMGYQD